MKLTIGTATRSRWRPDPVIHLMVELGGGYMLWCGNSPGMRAGTEPLGKPCPHCKRLAQDAYDNGELERSEAPEFLAPAKKG